ncbi:1666_t:CDS:2 [Diversispora eburnea]|uniref:1666_t:CDS:1 n=1 Tax=Diversispora eburnea TaxID=1213867 RepID=A0A9N8Z8U1_9GLOM|nr:1666_t:CDS:2 [Diversispora eburnea]
MSSSSLSLIGFQALKALIILVAIVCGILEATEYYAWSSYVDEVNNSNYYAEIPKSRYFKKHSKVDGHVKIWYYIVIILTILGTSLANLDPLYSGAGLSCSSIQTTGHKKEFDNKIAQWTKLQCNLAVSSLVIGWLNTVLWLISLIVAWRTSGRDLNDSSPTPSLMFPSEVRHSGSGNGPIYF